jgi:ATP-binding cassette subfamily B protein
VITAQPFIWCELDLPLKPTVRVDWRLAIFAVLPAPAGSFAVVFFGRRIHDRFEKIQGMFSDISSRVQENLSAFA